MAMTRISKTRKRVAFVILLLLSIVWVLPLIWGFSTSIKPNIEISENVLSLIPKNPTFKNYQELFTNMDQYPILLWLKNSAVVAVTHTVLYLILISLAGYAFAILQWRGRDFVFWLLLTTMMIPNVINLVPLFTMINQFNWFNSFWALIVPGLGGVFGLFIVRSFFLGIPKDLVESAQMDGASHLRIFSTIILPLGKSSLMVAGLFAFMGNWNDYLWPTLVMFGADIEKLTLPSGLSLLQSNTGYDYGLTMAAAIISIIPVIIVYCFVQDKIIEGVSRTGIK